MNTTQTRGKSIGASLRAVVAGAAATARHLQKLLIVVALALGAILLAPNAPIAHAAPLVLHASDNPVYFGPFDTRKTIKLTWTPVVGATLSLNFGGDWIGTTIPLEGTDSWDTDVYLGETGTVFLRNEKTGDVGPTLTITTRRADIAIIPQPPNIPQPPDITLIPKPGLPGPGPERPGVVRPGAN